MTKQFSSPYAMYSSDKNLEAKGIWLDFGAFRIRVARAGGSNQKFKIALEQKLRPHQLQIKAGTMDNDLALRLLAEAYAEAIVLDWENVTDAAGKPMAFTEENVVKLFTDLPELFNEVQEQAGKLSNFRALEQEEAAQEVGNA